MARKYKLSEIHLQVDDVAPFVNEKYSGFLIVWSSDIGFGTYMVYKPVGSDEWFGDSEYMDDDEDKEFISELMKLFINKMNVV